MCVFVVLALLFSVTVAIDLAYETVEAKDGSNAKMMCNITPIHPPDKVNVVLWYRGNTDNPFYKYDARTIVPEHWSDPSSRNKYIFQMLNDERIELSVGSVTVSDEDIYHCQVDFSRSPSMITYINLTIIVPPQGVQVIDDIGPVKNGITSAYAEGASITLTCLATGGKPLPQVTWKRDDKPITNETQYFPERRKSQSVLRIVKLLRSHLLAVHSCEVSNSVQSPPLVVRVAIEMYLRPLEVKLLGQNEPLSAGKRIDIVCRCKGSRPPATITWWKDGVSLEGGTVEVSTDDNTTTSSLRYSPLASDHGLTLTCKASNQRIPLSEMRDTWMLKVFYPPKVTLTLGQALDGNNIKEGDDVYFECHLIANPWVLRVWWVRDGQRLHSNTTNGIIVSNQTLVLQRVSRLSSGRYCCEASNSEGTTRSSPFYLRVKFEPVCSDGLGKKLLGAAKGEPLKVECKVDAEPAAALFRWSFNSTPGISKDLTEFVSEPGRSILTYIPKALIDYGTLQCWGRNDLGSQAVPCVYQVVRAGPPEPPESCTASNTTHHSVVVSCQKGFDGGLKQKFGMVLNYGDNLLANLSGPIPEFSVNNLEPSQDYTAEVYSINIKGLSKTSTMLQFRTLPAPGLKEQRRSTGPNIDEKSTGSWLYILLAACSTLIVAATIGTIILAVRRFKVDSPIQVRQQRNPKQEELPLNSHVSSHTDNTTTTDDKNPDLIPPSNETLLDYSVPYTITTRPSSKRNSATQMPVKPYHVTWAPILQSRNCATQTPPSHKESSV